jgi:hypothetical protein
MATTAFGFPVSMEGTEEMKKGEIGCLEESV